MARASDQDNHYATLGVPSDATAQAIKARYQELSHACNPEAFPPGSHRQMNVEKMRGITEAFQILSDPKARRAYDTRPDEAKGPLNERLSAGSEAPSPSVSSNWPNLSMSPSRYPPLSHLTAQGTDYNWTGGFSGTLASSMASLACRFVDQCKSSGVPASYHWSRLLERNDSQCALDCFSGPFLGTDCYVRVRVTFKRMGGVVSSHVSHQLVLLSPIWKRLAIISLRLALAAAFTAGSVALTMLPADGLMLGAFLVAALAIHEVLDQRIRNGPFFGGFSRAYHRVRANMTFTYFNVFIYGLFTVSAAFNPEQHHLEQFCLPILLSSAMILLHIVLTGFKPRDFPAGSVPWPHLNTAVKDAIVHAVMQAVRSQH